jgi:hypothetical protein
MNSQATNKTDYFVIRSVMQGCRWIIGFAGKYIVLLEDPVFVLIIT